MQGAGIIAKRVSAVSRAGAVMKGGVVITFPPSSTFQNALLWSCRASFDPIFPFSPLVEIHQSSGSMTAEISLNRNYSVCFFASLRWAEKLLQPQNILLGWCLWSGISCPPLLAGGCRASRPHQWGTDPPHLWGLWGLEGVWKDLGMFSPWGRGIFRSFKLCPL